MYLRTPRALVEGSWIVMFSASIGGGSRCTTSYYRAGTPSYTSSEGPARLLYCSLANDPSQTQALISAKEQVTSIYRDAEKEGLLGNLYTAP